ncbi:hypothetical protein HRG_009232 [Hirsutella rhossiliensis]|uniref:Mid2 domain-containing protein n=1 Tax=Hirsutella rhossiliensis TaxID=111463 RepID=A0A9P8SFH6_9HYPO|nr:uncharacterized protein HRG_09232 [Hirsutella rhossiliensis]KAH0959450.1 hypothetical protein HRG_09232 [Hirsutella rhossiliensis]
MARNPAVFGFTPLAVLLCAAAASAILLPDDVSRLVPGCAQGCFLSFLAFNYGAGGNGEVPSLGWLCSTPGDSEYTVGEGAVQCLAAEKSFGSCSQEEASPLVIYRAHRMCHGLPHAIRPTHGVVTATLILPPVGGGGQVSFPPPQSTHAMTRSAHTPSVSTSATLTANTTTRKSSTARSSTSTSSSVLSTRTRTSASEARTPTGVPIGVGDGKQQDGSGGSLTAGQKAGISVGVIGLAALAVGVIALFRFYRRRQRNPYRRSDSTEALHRRDTWGYKVDKGGSSGGNSWLARPNQPVPPPPPDNLAPPGRYVSTSWRPSAIGLAVSPGHHPTQTTTTTTTPPPPRSTPTRPLSRLLPAKPAMALGATKTPSSHPDEAACPQVRLVQASPPYARSRAPPPAPPKLHIPEHGGGGGGQHAVAGASSQPGHGHALGRSDSTMTEFEEDGRATSLSPEGRIWRPPSTSAATYYVADKHGNWVLGDPKRVSHAAEISVVTPVTAATPRPGVANALVLPAAQKALKVESRSPLLTAAEQPQPQPDGAAARTLTTRPGARAAEPPPPPPPPSAAVLTSPELRQRAFPPRPLFSSARLSQTRRPRAVSADSGVTTIATLSDDDDDGCDYDYYGYDDGGGGDDNGPPQHPESPLSPVTESPRSGAVRRSPVSYPRIVGGRRLSSRAPAGARPLLLLGAPPHLHNQYPYHHHPSLVPGHGPRPARQQQQQLAMARGGGATDDDAGPHLPDSSSTVRLVRPSTSPPDESDRGHLPSASRVASLRQAPSPYPAEQAQHRIQHGPAQRQQQPRRPPPNWTSGLPARPRPRPSRPSSVTPWLSQPRRQQGHHDPYYYYRYDDYDYDHDHDHDREHQHRYQHQQPHHHHHQRQHSLPNPQPHDTPPRPPPPQPSCSSSSASSSSLIVKRLGPARAAHMSITTTTDPLLHRPPPRPATQQHEQQHEQQHSQQQQQQQQQPSGTSGNNSRPWRRQSTPGPLYLSPELVTPRPLPGHDDDGAAAPSWVPRLTPTRRGEHLYPNVR